VVIMWFECEVAAVIDTKVGCAAGGWMDVDDGGREERKSRGEEGFCSRYKPAGKSSGSPWQLAGTGTEQYWRQ
jgi:hypothetical protein